MMRKEQQSKDPSNVDSSRFHFLTPDYDRPLNKLPPDLKKRIMDKLNFLYDKEKANFCFKEIDRLLKVYDAHKSPEMIDWEKNFNPHNRFTEKDIILITYGNLITEEGVSPLKTLTNMCEKYLEGVINTIHILPFFPYSSDRGFAVMDFEQVDPNLGSWDDIDVIEKKAVEHGGLISYKDNGDGTVRPYEADITWYSAINREDSKESIDFKVKRFLASRSIALVMMGIPGVYLHGLLGSKNDTEAITEGKSARSINRKTLNKNALIAALPDKKTTTFKISSEYGSMIRKRINEKAFHPNAAQTVLKISDSLFSLIRTSVDEKQIILAITNITDKKQHLEFDTSSVGLHVRS